MRAESRVRCVSWKASRLACLAGALLVGLVVPHADAIDLSSGEFRLNLDTTVSWGAAYRLEDRDMRIIGLPNGGTAYSVNGDDGDLNFDKGIYSNTLGLTVEVEMSYKNFGAFVRGRGFYDYEIENNDRVRTQLGDAALERVGSRAELLDAFAWLKFTVMNLPAEVRVGKQVLSWGESTFIQNSINVINPVDVSALRVPGAELRNALIGVNMISASLGMTENTTLEAFYQLEWEQTWIDPPGSYFSTNDFAGVGGTHVFLAFGSFGDIAAPPFYADPNLGHPFMGVPRGATDDADDSGQFGVSLRWLVPSLNNTELGFYFINYHSRLPAVNGHTGTVAGAQAAGPAGQRAAGRIYAYFGVPPGASPQVDAMAAAAGQAAATDAYASTAYYFLSYPEDIKLYGVSFNTQLGTSGIALQGEASYRENAPLLVDDVELLFAALSPISAGLAATNQVVPGGAALDTDIDGYIRRHVGQFQATATKVFGPGLGADQTVIVAEAGMTHVFDMPNQSVLRLEGPGTYTSGNPIHSAAGGAHAGKPYEDDSHFADASSWGYRIAGRMEFNNAIGAVNLTPRFAWSHDVSGVSPGPGGNFLAGSQALTLGIAGTYQNAWEVDLAYTMYQGAGRWNLTNDRDFIATTVKFSF
jgi:hypothetical protein